MSKRNVLALIGEDAPYTVIDALKQKGFEVFSLKRDPRLPLPVSSHADMLIFCAGDKIFMTEEYALSSQKLISLLEGYGYNIILSSSVPDNVYPKDILFNMAPLGKRVIGNIPFCDTTVTDHLMDNGYEFYTVKQGYTKCSTAIVGDNAIITADMTIAKIAASLGIDVLRVNSYREVKLDGYDYGFIGGACGYYDNTLYFSGNIEAHPEYQAISDFCKMHSTVLCSLSSEPLYDVGSIFFIKDLKG